MDYMRKEIQNQAVAPYLDWIKSGKKEYEGRLQCKIKEWDLFIGKRIQFYDKENSESYVLCEITSLETFNDFGEAFDLLGEKLIPNKNREEVVNLYNGLFHYEGEDVENMKCSSKMINNNGVVAIGLKILTQQ